MVAKKKFVLTVYSKVFNYTNVSCAYWVCILEFGVLNGINHLTTGGTFAEMLNYFIVYISDIGYIHKYLVMFYLVFLLFFFVKHCKHCYNRFTVALKWVQCNIVSHHCLPMKIYGKDWAWLYIPFIIYNLY